MVSLDVLYEDNHIIAVNKKPSEIVQGDKTGDEPLSEKVKNYIKEKYNKPGAVYLGVTHRIDRPTSGIVLFAKTSKALTRLNQMFQDKTIAKTYWAVVSGTPDTDKGTLINHLAKNAKQNKSYVTEGKKQGSKLAELDYELIGNGNKYSLLVIHPKTGRHHQIRAQLSHMGTPIKGDLKYGSKRSNSDGSIHLHARAIEFIHPIQKTNLRITASPPKDVLWDMFKGIVK